MVGTLAHLLKRKFTVAALAAALVVGGGTTVALAAAGSQQPTPRATHTQGQSSQAHSHDGNDDNNHGRNTSQDSRQIEGVLKSIDANNDSFVVASEHNGDVIVVVTAKTAFDDGVSSFADLTVGMFVEVNGNFQTDNRLTATRIERGDDAATGDDHSNSGDDHRGSGDHGGSGSSGSGRGGHDDGVPHG